MESPVTLLDASAAEVRIDFGIARAEVAQRASAAAHAEQLAAIDATLREASAFPGDVALPNARLTAELVATLPDGSWAAFDAELYGAASRLAPARFRAKARAVRERLQPEAASARHKRGAAPRRAEERRIWVEPHRDGMCWLISYLPAASLWL